MSLPKNIALLIVLFMPSFVTLAAEGRYVIGVDGLACPYCAYSLEKQIKGIEGVENVTIDLKHSRAMITMAQDRSLSKGQARQAVEDAGFTMKTFGSMESEPMKR